MYDCIVVGAGPSGGAAAYHLAKQGRSVLVLERTSLPRYKPCGGGVSPQVAQWFDFDFSPAISLRVKRIRCTWQMADPVESEVPDNSALWMVRRDRFDHFLIQQGQRQGADLWTETKAQGISFKSDRWQVDTSRGPVEGRYLIAADGARGSMAKWLGFTRRRYLLAGALEIEPRLEIAETPIIHLEIGLLNRGYLWNFPKADGYSIGAGVMRTGPQRRQNLQPLVADYTPQFGVVMAQEKAYGHPILAWNGTQPLHTQQALLVGEAACVVDPFTAEGIRPALLSGVKAAAAVNRALAGDRDALADYTRVMQAEWGRDMQWAQRLAQAFYRAPRLTYRIGVKHPQAAATMIQVFNGQLSYSEMTQKAIRRLSGGLVG